MKNLSGTKQHGIKRASVAVLAIGAALGLALAGVGCGSKDKNAPTTPEPAMTEMSDAAPASMEGGDMGGPPTDDASGGTIVNP